MIYPVLVAAVLAQPHDIVAELAKLAAATPPPACLHAVFTNAEGETVIAGYDMGSGAWYRSADNRIFAFVPGVGAIHGYAARGGLRPEQKGQVSDSIVERWVFPQLYVAQIIANPACVLKCEPTPDGRTVIELRSIWGDPRRLQDGDWPMMHKRIIIAESGCVEEISEIREKKTTTDKLITHEMRDGIYQVASEATLEWSFVSAKVAPAGTPQKPAFSVDFIEQLALAHGLAEYRSAPTFERREASKAPPGSAPIGGSVRRDSGMRWSWAMILSGATIVGVAAAGWWIRRRGLRP